MAGKYRTCELRKGSTLFALPAAISLQSERIFSELKHDKLFRGHNQNQVAASFAYYLGELNVLHPFREGNGRTQRVFLTHLARDSGFALSWGNVSEEQMVDASVASFRGDNSKFREIISTGLTPLQPAPTVTPALGFEDHQQAEESSSKTSLFKSGEKKLTSDSVNDKSEDFELD